MYIGMLRRGPDLLQYYVGYDFTHGEYVSFDEMRGRGRVFAARQRRDGFVSVHAGQAGGQFSTPPVVFDGRRLVLNLDASGTGAVTVELEDAQGLPLRGFAFADCDPVLQNQMAAPVSWRQGGTDLSALAGQTVRLAFRLHSADLYSFQFTE